MNFDRKMQLKGREKKGKNSIRETGWPSRSPQSPSPFWGEGGKRTETAAAKELVDGEKKAAKKEGRDRSTLDVGNGDLLSQKGRRNYIYREERGSNFHAQYSDGEKMPF